jgi:hypothetical protein
MGGIQRPLRNTPCGGTCETHTKKGAAFGAKRSTARTAARPM